MKNFKPSQALNNFWGLILESDTFEDFCKEGGFDQQDQEYIAAKEYYKNWKDKVLLFCKSLYFDSNHVIKLDGFKIKQFIAVATEEEIFYFFVKDIS